MHYTYFDALIKLGKFNKDDLELIQYDLDNIVFNYGEQFKNSHKKTNNKYSIFKNLVKCIIYRYKNRENYKSSIISEAYNNWGVNDYLKKSGYNVLPMPWLTSNFFLSDERFVNFLNSLKNDDFNIILSSTIKEIPYIKNKISDFLIRNQIKLVILANDMTSINRIVIDVCRNINVKTLIYLHGLPGRYNSIDDNRADYLAVWGDKIKDLYISAGVSPNKIIVTGNPYYTNKIMKPIKETSYDSVLILSKAICGAPSNSSSRFIENRGQLLEYVFQVEKVLNALGIKKVILRLHPSENPQWYKKFINTQLFEIDNRSLEESINSSSMIISPTTTVIFDALYNGVPFYAFEPYEVCHQEVVPPFDGSDEFLPVARSTNDLLENIQKRKMLNQSLVEKYISKENNFEYIKQLIQDRI